MRSEPILVEGVAGTVVVEAPMVGRPTVLVDGVPVPREKGTLYLLPALEGEPLVATVRSGPGMSPYPRLRVDGQDHLTGPTPPLWLSLLGIAPILAPLLGGGPGFLVAFAGIVAAWVVLRRRWSLGATAAGVLGVLAVTFLVAWAIGRAVYG